MGRKFHQPRRGSLAFRPRARKKTREPRIRNWPEWNEEPRLLGFAGYKVGMGDCTIPETREGSPFYGTEIQTPFTIVETPPLFVAAVRIYEEEHGALNCIGEVWTTKLPKYLNRVFTPPSDETLKEWEDIEKRVNELKEKLDPNKKHVVRVIAVTQPHLIKLKKKPDVFEIQVGGEFDKALEYAISKLGQTIRINEVFEVGECVDVFGITKGKGFAGVVKRFGVKRKSHKSRKTVREVGSIGPIKPAHVMSTIPRAGQLGVHQRMVYSRVIHISLEDAKDPISAFIREAAEKGGIKHYGILRSDFLMLKGSIPGPSRSLVKLRKSIRKLHLPRMPIKITAISFNNKYTMVES